MNIWTASVYSRSCHCSFLIVAEVIGTYTALLIFLDSIVQMCIINTPGFFNIPSHAVCYSSGPIGADPGSIKCGF